MRRLRTYHLQVAWHRLPHLDVAEYAPRGRQHRVDGKSIHLVGLHPLHKQAIRPEPVADRAIELLRVERSHARSIGV